jgi:hypothetical protein
VIDSMFASGAGAWMNSHDGSYTSGTAGLWFTGARRVRPVIVVLVNSLGGSTDLDSPVPEVATI